MCLRMVNDFQGFRFLKKKARKRFSFGHFFVSNINFGR